MSSVNHLPWEKGNEIGGQCAETQKCTSEQHVRKISRFNSTNRNTPKENPHQVDGVE